MCPIRAAAPATSSERTDAVLGEQRRHAFARVHVGEERQHAVERRFLHRGGSQWFGHGGQLTTTASVSGTGTGSSMVNGTVSAGRCVCHHPRARSLFHVSPARQLQV